MSFPQPSADQRLQQLESTVMSLQTQVADLTRELQSARTQREELQVRLDEQEEINENSAQNHECRLIQLERRVDNVDGGQDGEQYDDSN